MFQRVQIGVSPLPRLILCAKVPPSARIQGPRFSAPWIPLCADIFPFMSWQPERFQPENRCTF